MSSSPSRGYVCGLFCWLVVVGPAIPRSKQQTKHAKPKTTHGDGTESIIETANHSYYDVKSAQAQALHTQRKLKEVASAKRLKTTITTMTIMTMTIMTMTIMTMTRQ